ncbi:ABC transporter substrate-binding protein [Candidatus Pelagadaptatus aseana]|uniref:ABC transporter substrate-binding protein n=1 Tax=Candidatus Pelagadaptatus aseana TaxID=3120508 RepID=UPI003C6EEAAA
MSLTLLSGCGNSDQDHTIRIALNPWPGYEYLYLAEQKGFFKEEGANIEIVQLMSLSDSQRAYTNGRVDGLASTLIEAVQAEPLGGAPLSVILVSDFSNGGDVILANNEIDNMSALKGKTVGAELSSLGLFVLQRALTRHGMTLEDVRLVNTEQAQGLNALQQGRIDAFVTYPPESLNILNQGGYQQIFDSSEIPFEIIDTLAIAKHILQAKPELPGQIHRAWQKALDYTKHNPDDALQIMAERQGITVEEFQAVTNDLFIIDSSSQANLLNDPLKIETSAKAVCKTLVHTGALQIDCNQMKPIAWKGAQ